MKEIFYRFIRDALEEGPLIKRRITIIVLDVSHEKLNGKI